MRKLLPLFILMSGCAINNPELLPEDELFLTRRYVGQFVSYSFPEKVPFGEAPVMAIHTTIPDFDTIKIYARKIDVPEGERMYIRRTWHSQSRYWFFTLETEKKSFRICEFGIGDKLLTQTWY